MGILDWMVGWVVGTFVKFLRRLTRLPLKKRLAIVGLLITYFILPIYVWGVLAIGVIYWVFIRSRGGQEVVEDLDILGNARWARYTDMYVGLGSQQTPKPALLSQVPEEQTMTVLGRVTFPAPKKKQPPVVDYVVSTSEGHILTVAQTGAGKGVNVVIPNVLAYQHSVLVLDPKGENFIKTHFFRETQRGQEICLIDPFGEVPKEVGAILKRLEMTNHPQSAEAIAYFKNLRDKTSTYGQYLKGFNPLQIIEDLLEKGDDDQILDEANVIADMIVVKTHQDKDPHWNEKAKSFIRGIILYVTFSKQCQKNRTKYPLTLITVKELIEDVFSKPVKMEGFVDSCLENPKLKSIAATVSMIADQERSSVLSAILRHLDFLDSNNVQESLVRNDFQLDDIRIHPKTIYLVLPASKISAYNRLARLWISSIKSSLERINDGFRETRPVLFMLDEVAQLGRMEPLLNAVSLSRSFGLKLWLIFQDVAQMKMAYPEDEWRSFFSNTKAQQFFGISPTDTETCKFVSDAIGQTTISFVTQSYSEGVNQGSSYNSGSNSGGGQDSYSSGSSYSYGKSQTYSTNQQVQARPLVLPSEVPQVTIDNILIFGVTKFPIMAYKMPYYQIPFFESRHPAMLGDGLKEKLLL